MHENGDVKVNKLNIWKLKIRLLILTNDGNVYIIKLLHCHKDENKVGILIHDSNFKGRKSKNVRV